MDKKDINGNEGYDQNNKVETSGLTFFYSKPDVARAKTWPGRFLFYVGGKMLIAFVYRSPGVIAHSGGEQPQDRPTIRGNPHFVLCSPVERGARSALDRPQVCNDSRVFPPGRVVSVHLVVSLNAQASVKAAIAAAADY